MKRQLLGTLTLALALATPAGSALRAPLEALVEQARPAVVLIVVEQPQRMVSGSGFLISADGYIVTARHVVEDASRVLVLLWNAPQWLVASVVRYGSTVDVAVLKVQGKQLPFLRFGDSSRVREGQEVLVLGYPFVSVLGREAVTATRGIISAVRSSQGALQIDAAMNPGNSGGPVLNSQGEVIGVAVAGVRGGQGVNFAISSNTVRPLTERLTSTPIPPPSSATSPGPLPPIPAPSPTLGRHPYWPLISGAQWHYEWKGTPSGSIGTLTRRVTRVTPSQEGSVIDTEDEERDGIYRNTYRVTPRGIVWVQAYPPQAGVRWSFPTPFLILPWPISDGFSWEGSYIVEAGASTEVHKETRRIASVQHSFNAPAGTFSNCIQVLGAREVTVSGPRGSGRFGDLLERVYCEGTGMVYARTRDIGSGETVQYWLTKYVVPK